MWKTTLAIATAAAVLLGSPKSYAATLNLSFSPHQMSAIRIEPPRPGGLYGLPRGMDGSRDIAAEGSADKRVQATKRRPR
jgi:hypothetical protein